MAARVLQRRLSYQVVEFTLEATLDSFARLLVIVVGCSEVLLMVSDDSSFFLLFSFVSVSSLCYTYKVFCGRLHRLGRVGVRKL